MLPGICDFKRQTVENLAIKILLLNNLSPSLRLLQLHPWMVFGLLTFDDGQSAPLDLLPAAVDEPLVDLLHQLCQVVRVRLHDLVKLFELNQRRETHGQTQKCKKLFVLS